MLIATAVLLAVALIPLAQLRRDEDELAVQVVRSEPDPNA
jgi:hypothetical protein